MYISFSEAIVKGLRMNPDVILVGEMRDLATIEAAILAAETGHLVLATLHTTSAAQTVDRIINVFPPQQQEQVRMQLSTSILAIYCQQLLIKATKKDASPHSNNGHDSVDPESDTREEDVPHNIRYSDRGEVRDEDLRLFAYRIIPA